RTLTARCIRGITANTDHLRLTVEQSIGLVTALNPHLGYTTATAIAQEALATGKGVAELVLEHNLLTAEQLEDLLSPQRLANLSK
ncbi:aspartate ammonia-lyase, partial [Pseudarthrobacter sp. PvP022]